MEWGLLKQMLTPTFMMAHDPRELRPYGPLCRGNRSDAVHRTGKAHLAKVEKASQQNESTEARREEECKRTVVSVATTLVSLGRKQEQRLVKDPVSIIGCAPSPASVNHLVWNRTPQTNQHP